MKRVSAAILVALLAAAIAWVQVAPQPAQPLTQYLPAGPLLVLEARDFATLLQDWNDSPVKAAWLAGDNYGSFSRSKLFLRLEEAHGEFAAAAGLPAEMALVESIAGGESALGLYDVGELRFLYISELAAADALENALWNSRANFESRQASGQTFYVRIDPESKREVAFAAVDHRLILSTAADLLAQSLALLSGQPADAASSQAWYADAIAATGPRADLRMVQNLTALARTPHMRSYWIQRNMAALGQYRAGVVDAFRTSDEIREERVWLRNQPGQADTPDLSGLAKLIPDGATLYRLRPDQGDAADLLQAKLLAPEPGGVRAYGSAPPPPQTTAVTGAASQLETLIDVEPRREAPATYNPQPLAALVASSGLIGVLDLQSIDPSADAVFAASSAAVALLASLNWDQDAALAVLVDSSAGLWTVSGLGAAWQPRSGYFALDGLQPLFVAVDGPLLIVSDSAPLLESMLARASLEAAPSDYAFSARFDHAAAAAPYRRVMRSLDFLQGARFGLASGPNREPHLFSENIAGLSDALSGYQSLEIVRRDRASHISETVVYR
jgi:hypothetical protein